VLVSFAGWAASHGYPSWGLRVAHREIVMKLDSPVAYVEEILWHYGVDYVVFDTRNLNLQHKGMNDLNLHPLWGRLEFVASTYHNYRMYYVRDLFKDIPVTFHVTS